LRGAALSRVFHQVTDLRGADLRGAWLSKANLTNARYDARTRWPAGFDPLKHGAVLTP
jgi:uncharacterized protein YjbI with pentapeptide repeats